MFGTGMGWMEKKGLDLPVCHSDFYGHISRQLLVTALDVGLQLTLQAITVHGVAFPSELIDAIG